MNSEKFSPLLAKTSPYPLGIEVDRAEGSYIYDKSGKAFLDFISGIGVSALGHAQPAILKAIKDQADKYLHTMVYGEHVQSPQVQLATKICSLLPQSLNCCYFVNSGTEANEVALKLVKRLTGRKKIIALHGAYHGSTHGSLSVSDGEQRKNAFRPLLPNVHFISINDESSLESIDSSFAAVIAEPIQGDAGVRIPDVSWMQKLRAACTENGVLLILDEIQTGLGRTGKTFAFEHFGIEPDLLTLGKSLGGGMPIGALVGSAEKLEAFTHDPMLGHITTFGGHPVACAAAGAGLDILSSEIDLEHVESIGARIESALSPLSSVREIRRKGLFFAIDMECEAAVQKAVEQCLERGLLIYWFLSCPTSFRMAPPLNLGEKELIEALDTLTHVLSS